MHATPLPLRPRLPLIVRYAPTLGWLMVCDAAFGQWHQVRSQDAPASWRRMAYLEKLNRRTERQSPL